MNGPLVSIILTSYNYERYVGDAIRSALGQTYRNLELLVLDNHSTDGSMRVIRSFEDPRIVVVEHPENIGLWPNQNAGIRMARGEYVLFLSADDLLFPWHVAGLVAYHAAHPDVDVRYSPYLTMDAAGRVLDRFEHPAFDAAESFAGRNELAGLLTRDSYVCFPTVLFRKALFDELGMLDESLSVGSDYEFFARMAAAGKRFAFDAAPGVCVRVHSGNLSGLERFVGTGQQLREYSRIFEKYVVPEHFEILAGYRRDLEMMMHNKLLAVKEHFPERYGEIEAATRDEVAAARARIAAVPETAAATLRGQPLISVILPTTSRIGPLARALHSLGEQEYGRWEAVVVCDGSYDPSGYVASLPFADQVRVVRLLTRGGPSVARNAGIHAAAGDVICYLDEDNRFEPGYLGTLARSFTDPAVEVTLARARLCVEDEHGETLLSEDGPFDLREGAVSRVAGNAALNAAAHRRAVVQYVGYFNGDLPVFEDWEFLLRATGRFGARVLPAVACEVRLRRGLQGHHLFGRTTSVQWSDVGRVIGQIYAAYPARSQAELDRRTAYAAGLQACVNRGVAAAQDPAAVARFLAEFAGVADGSKVG